MKKLNITLCSFPDYSGNAKALYEYMVKRNYLNHRYVWIVYNQKTKEILDEKNIECILIGTDEFRKYIKTTDVFFTTQGNLDGNKTDKSLYIELWHGVGPKAIGYLCKNPSHEDIKGYNNIRKIVDSILSDPHMFHGMKVTDIQIDSQQTWENGEYHFRLASPILIKRSTDLNNIKFYTYEDVESERLMTETLKHKMNKAGLPEDETLCVKFDMSYPNKKLKLVDIHGIKNKCSMCPIIITGKSDSIAFARNVGIGNSTGSGFGAIY